MTPVRATHQHGRRTQYRLQGGAWDGPDLDTLLRHAPRPRIGAPHDALVDGDIRLTAADIEDLTAALAGGLQALGVRRRDAVAWQLAPGYEAVLLFRACWRLGAVAVPVPHHADAAAVDAVLALVEPAVLVGANHLPLGLHRDAVVVGGPSLPSRRPARADAADAHDAAGAGAHARTTRSGAPFAKLLAAEPVGASLARDADVAAVFATGIGTGRIRGVVHTHRTLAAKARTLPERDGLGSADVVLVPDPSTTAAGLLLALVVPELVGMTTVLLPDWNPTIALDVIERERVSYLAGTPGTIRALLREPTFSSRRVRSVRLVTLTGDTVTPAFATRAAAQLGAHVKRAYGSTEAPLVAVASPAADATETHHHDGRAVGDTELRVVDPARGRDLAPGDEGELWVRGPEVFAGYVDPHDNDGAFARGGWFRTGDLALLDPGGTVTITGRLEDALEHDGRPVGIAPLEAWLQGHPAVDDAAVVGSGDDDDPGASAPVVAFVTLRPTDDTGPREAAERILAEGRAWLGAAADAAPVRLHAVRVRRSLPRSPSGRIDRAALRAGS